MQTNGANQVEKVKYTLLTQINTSDSALRLLFESIRKDVPFNIASAYCSDCNLGILAQWNEDGCQYDVSFETLSDEVIDEAYHSIVDLSRISLYDGRLFAKETIIITPDKIEFNFASYSLHQYEYRFTLDKLKWNELTNVTIKLKNGHIEFKAPHNIIDSLNLRGQQRNQVKGNYSDIKYEKSLVETLMKLEWGQAIHPDTVKKIRHLFESAWLKENLNTGQWITGWLLHSIYDVLK